MCWQIQLQSGRKEGEMPCTVMLPSIRTGLKAEADKAAAIEQWGSLAALKPELFVNAHLCNPDTPASNADTPKAAGSPQRQANEEEESAERDLKDFARVPTPTPKEAEGTHEYAQMTEEQPAQMTDLEAAARAASVAVASADCQWQPAAAFAFMANEPASRQSAEKIESDQRDAARKRKAEEMGLGELGEDELLAAEILSGSFLSGGLQHSSTPGGGRQNSRGGGGNRAEAAREGKRPRQASAKAAAAALLEPPSRGKGAGAARSRAVQGGKQQQLKGGSQVKAVAVSNAISRGKGGSAVRGASVAGTGLDDIAHVSAASWVKKVVSFLETNGQDLLASICAHYRIDFCGDVSSIREYSLEQLAHNAIFNPALPKASGRLPKMLRDVASVSQWSGIPPTPDTRVCVGTYNPICEDLGCRLVNENES